MPLTPFLSFPSCPSAVTPNVSSQVDTSQIRPPARSTPQCTLSHKPALLLPQRRAAHPRREGLRVARLHVDRAWTDEFAHQPLAGRQVADDAAAGDALEVVLAVPGDEVAVVDDVFLSVA